MTELYRKAAVGKAGGKVRAVIRAKCASRGKDSDARQVNCQGISMNTSIPGRTFCGSRLSSRFIQAMNLGYAVVIAALYDPGNQSLEGFARRRGSDAGTLNQIPKLPARALSRIANVTRFTVHSARPRTSIGWPLGEIVSVRVEMKLVMRAYENSPHVPSKQT